MSQPRDLFDEAWLKLARTQRIQFKSRAHFYSWCSRLLRKHLADQARRRKSESQPQIPTKGLLDVAALDDALTKLEKISPRRCQVVEMRYFGEMSIEEIASVLDVPSRTVKRDEVGARVHLFQFVQDELQ